MNANYWPSEDWKAGDPALLGMSLELLSDLEMEISTRFRSINAFMVVKGGYLVFERYSSGLGPDDKHLVASVTKSFISALIGIAIERGNIEGVHQRVLDFFPEYKPGPDERLKRQLTVKHLLAMRAGFQWRTGARASEQLIDCMRRSKDWVAFILGLPMRERNFGNFQYNSADSHLLSAIITRSTRVCAEQFASLNLFAPIGMEQPGPGTQRSFNQEEVFLNTSGAWPKDPQGNSIGGWGLHLKPRDMARFGLLYVRAGRWGGEQVIPAKWVADSVSMEKRGYGYQWWLRKVKGVFVFFAYGRGGNHIYCIPGMDLVVVIASKPASRWKERWPLVEDYVIPALLD